MDAPQTSDTTTAASLRHPTAPRPLTPLVRRRAWTDPRVRAWLLITGAMVLLAIALLIAHYLGLRREAWLVREGLPVDAAVLQVGHDYIQGHGTPAEIPIEIHIRYEVKGVQHEYFALLPGFDQGWAIVGKPLRIHVNPDDPKEFTARQAPPPLRARAIADLSLLIPASITLAVGVWKRRRLLRTWTDGELTPAYSLGSKPVATAPGTRCVSCSSTDAQDSRVLSVYLPSKAGKFPKGEVLWVIVPTGGRGMPAAAGWFDRGE